MATLSRLTAKCSGDLLAVCVLWWPAHFTDCEVGNLGGALVELRRPWGSLPWDTRLALAGRAFCVGKNRKSF